MSLKGAILVYQCDDDHCDDVLVINIERDNFEDAGWFFGVTHDYCRMCCHRIRNASMIETDEIVWNKTRERIASAIARRIERIDPDDNELILDLSRHRSAVTDHAATKEAPNGNSCH